jgi:hypothetical protein
MDWCSSTSCSKSGCHRCAMFSLLPSNPQETAVRDATNYARERKMFRSIL